MLVSLRFWLKCGNSVRLIAGNVFKEFNIHQIFLQKYPQMSFSTPYFLTRKKKKKKKPSTCGASEAVPHVLLAQWAACSCQPFRGSLVHLHRLYVVMLMSSWYPHWQAIFEGSHKPTAENTECVLFLLSSSRDRLVWTEPGKTAFHHFLQLQEKTL